MRALVIVLALTACETGGDSPALPDADLTKPMCTGVVYDSCLTNAALRGHPDPGLHPDV